MSLEQNNYIKLNNADNLADAINADMSKIVELNYDDSETVAIQTFINDQMAFLRTRNKEIHQPLQRSPGDSNQPNKPPVPVHAEVNDTDATKLIISFNANVEDPDGTGYSISGSTAATAVTNVEALGSTLTLTLNGAVANGETVLTSYDGLGSLVNADYPTIAAAAYADLPVTNNVA